jgi:S1-C subfamily serine protease
VVAVWAGVGLDRALLRTGSGSSNSSAASAPSALPSLAPSASANAGGSIGNVPGQVDPALVDINVTLGYQGLQAAGTGIVLTSTGEVLTNNHVITGATRITAVDIGNGRSYTASVVGYDRSHDLAVLALRNASGLTTAQLVDSSKVRTGDPVVAIGNAGGTGGTPNAADGHVTALDQSIVAGDDATGESERLTGLIQVDANVQPGDSGGPLVNSSGGVIGVDTAASQSMRSQNAGNQGFAIPINTALPIAQQIVSGKGGGTVHVGTTAFLGVQVSTVSGGSGALVVGAVPGSPAAQAGLTAGDVITSFGGRTIDSPNALTTQVAGHHPGDSVQVQWTDDTGASHSASVTLASGPPD